VDTGPKLIDFFDTYLPARRGNVTRRTGQRLIRQFNLPVIKIGQVTLIDEIAGDAQLAKFARRSGEPDPQRPRRGRPRTNGS